MPKPPIVVKWIYISVNNSNECGLIRIYVSYDSTQYTSPSDVLLTMMEGFREWLKTQNGKRYCKEFDRPLNGKFTLSDWGHMKRRSSLYNHWRDLGIFTDIYVDLHNKRYVDLLGYYDGDEVI